MVHPSRLLSVLLLALLPGCSGCYSQRPSSIRSCGIRRTSTGASISCGSLPGRTRVTTPDAIFRVSTRVVLTYDCHESAPLHPGRPLRAEAWHYRLPVDARAAVSVESPANFLADFLDLEPPPFVRTAGTLRVTDLGTGGFVETAAVVTRSGHGFSCDTVYRTQFDPAVMAPERLLRAFHAGHAVAIRTRLAGIRPARGVGADH